MLPHSAALDDALVAGPVVTHKATVLRGGEPVLLGVQCTDDTTITFDEDAASIRSISGHIADPDGSLRPHLAVDPLAPYGSELQLEIGVKVGENRYEFLPAGVYRLERSGGPLQEPIGFSGGDRSIVVAYARDEVPWVIAGGAVLGDVVVDYLAAKYPGLEVVVDVGAYDLRLPYTPTVWLEGDQTGGPWENLRDLLAKFGRRIYLDAVGRAIVRPEPYLTSPADMVPTREYKPGPENIAFGVATEIDTTGVRNVWVVSGEGTGVPTPVSATAEITDPTSPIYPAGPFGRRPAFLVSSFLTSTAQCQDAADAYKARAQGANEPTTFSALPHPAHEPGDAVRVVSTDTDRLVALSSWSAKITLREAANYTTRRLA